MGRSWWHLVIMIYMVEISEDYLLNWTHLWESPWWCWTNSCLGRLVKYFTEILEGKYFHRVVFCKSFERIFFCCFWRNIFFVAESIYSAILIAIFRPRCHGLAYTSNLINELEYVFFLEKYLFLCHVHAHSFIQFRYDFKANCCCRYWYRKSCCAT